MTAAHPRRRFLMIASAAALTLPLAGRARSAPSATIREWRGIALGAEARLILDHPDADRMIAAALEDLAASAPDSVGTALVEVSGPEDELELTAPAGVEVRWIHRGGAFTPGTTRWVGELRAAPWREGRVHVFVHGEREQVKAARAFLTDERGVDRRHMSVSAYWAHGRAEDAFQAEKRTPLGQIFPDGPAGA